MLQESSLLLLPSAYEGQPMVALEALACGTPVLASNALHSLPDVISRPHEGTIECWADSIEDSSGTYTDVKDVIAQHDVKSINENLASVYASKLSSTSASG